VGQKGATADASAVTTPLPPALVAFVELFDRGAYWESHEVLEGAWRESRSDFYKGLILLASAYVHVARGNAHGVVAQLRKAEHRLEPYAPAYGGVDVAALLAHATRARRAIEDRLAGPAPDLPALVPQPRLVLTAAHVRGDEPELAPGGSRLSPPDSAGIDRAP
jgi:uncharacterized protein